MALLWPYHGQKERRTVLRHTVYTIGKGTACGWMSGFRERVEECRGHGHEVAVGTTSVSRDASAVETY